MKRLELLILLREAGSGNRATFLLTLSQSLGREPELPLAFPLGTTTTILATAEAGAGVVSHRAVASELNSGGLQELDVQGLRPERLLRAILGGTTTSCARGRISSSTGRADIARKLQKWGCDRQ